VRCFGIFAKYWEPGKVKTRLASGVGADRASQIYRAFVATVSARFAGIADQQTVCYWPADRRQEFAELCGTDWMLIPQASGDLGQRMSLFFEEAFSRGANRVVLIGSDSPTIPREFVERAFTLLEEHDVVLGPTDDGGYYLVGARKRTPAIFEEVSWSTPSVWEQTIARLQAFGLTYAQLPQWYDVDEAADLERLRAELSGSVSIEPSLKDLSAIVTAIIPLPGNVAQKPGESA
jgi:hypothetical protein